LTDVAKAIRKKHIDIFMGTWCGDSKREVPAMLKILNEIGFDSVDISLITVGNNAELYKKSPQGEELGKNIVRVPTFIIYDKKKEIGRIIEYPVESLERDLLKILRKEPYIPNYHQLRL
jgi:thiol-disulfide isomerase/thioredoxin